MDIFDRVLRITQVRSASGRKPVHRRTIEALGLKRIGHAVFHADNPAIRGMVNQVGYLLKVDEVELQFIDSDEEAGESADGSAEAAGESAEVEDGE